MKAAQNQTLDSFYLLPRCEDAYAQLEALESIRQRLETDLEDKTEALNIDLDQLRLTERSAGLTHKPNPTRIPPKSVQPEAW